MKVAYKFSSIILMVTFISGCVALITPDVKTEIIELKPGQYQLDPSHTSVLFKANHMGLSTYVGRFNEFDATLNFDSKDVTKLSLQALIDTATVDVNDEDLEDTLKNEDWFNVEKYPQAQFVSSSVTNQQGSNFIVNGTLTLAGKSVPLSLNAKYQGGAFNLLTGYHTIGFSASGIFKRSALGLDEYIPMIGDEITLEIHAEFQLVD